MVLTGRCYCHCGRWNSYWVDICFITCYLLILFIYFVLSSGLLNRTSSHMWGILYLPMILFRDGLLTHIDSFMNLMRFRSSLPTILKLPSVMLWPMMLGWSNNGEGALQMFFNPLSKCSWRFSYIFFLTFHPITSVSVYDATLLDYLDFVLGCHQDVAPFLKYIWMPCFYPMWLLHLPQ